MQFGRDVRHVLMTRFNLATPGRESALRTQPGWLEDRFGLFERYCLPSVAAQVDCAFDWIVYFDDKTPAPFRERIERCRAIFPFTPYFTPLFPAAGWPRSVAETVTPRTPWLLTTRLDNDDALAVDALARVQAAVAAGQPTRRSFNVTAGFVMRDGAVYALEHHSNAFASWLEPWDEATVTAASIPHMAMAEAGPVEQVPGPAGWLQVVHGANVSNRVRGRRVRPAEARRRFPETVLGALPEPSALTLTAENTVLTPLRAGRDRAVALARRALRR